jgi:hypothetical protein
MKMARPWRQSRALQEPHSGAAREKGEAVVETKRGMSWSYQLWMKPSTGAVRWSSWRRRRNLGWETSLLQLLQTREARRKQAGSSGGRRRRISSTSSSGSVGGEI